MEKRDDVHRKNSRKSEKSEKSWKIFLLIHKQLQKKCVKDEKKFCQFRKRLYFCSPVWDGKSAGERRGEIIEETETEGSVPEPNSPKGGAVRAENEKGRKDNSEEILTMKSLILAQDER